MRLCAEARVAQRVVAGRMLIKRKVDEDRNCGSHGKIYSKDYNSRGFSGDRLNIVIIERERGRAIMFASINKHE